MPPAEFCTGLLRLSVVLSPTWPKSFRPHDQREPSDLIAATCPAPQANEIQVDKVISCTGELVFVELPEVFMPREP